MQQNNDVYVPHIYTDRTLLSDLPETIAKELRTRNLYLDGKLESASFVGILITDGQPSVFLPRSVSSDIQDKKLINASNTIRAVTKYGSNSETRIDIMDEGEGRQSLAQLSLICELLDDFRKNGVYTRRREVRRLNSGKIDWKRTVSRVTPFHNINNQPVYIDSHGIKRQYFNNCEIAVIHARVIHQLDSRFSWIVTGNLNPIAPELRDYPFPKGNTDYQISRLKNELSQTYSDRDIRLLKMLIKHLEANGGSAHSNFIAGLEKFHFCWEHMLGSVLKNTVQLNNKLPAPAYIDKDGNELTANEKGMRTDIILYNKEKRSCTVADAKYYAATGTANAPGWGDIVKQLFYEKALNTLDMCASIKNAFIFPGIDGNLKEARIRDRVNSTADESIYIEEFKPIHCYYADPMTVIEHYINGKKMDELTELLLAQSTE